MAHVDRWSWSFQSGSGLPQNQVIRSTIEAVMQGARVGQAGDFFNLQWATLAALLGVQQGRHIQPVSPAALGNLFIASDDARNYTLLAILPHASASRPCKPDAAHRVEADKANGCLENFSRCRHSYGCINR